MYLWYFIIFMLRKIQWEEYNHSSMEEKELISYNESNMEKSGQFLKQLRTDARYTRQQLASIIGVSTDSLAGYEKGERLPPAEAIYILSQLFNVTFEELLAGERDSDHKEVQQSGNTHDEVYNPIEDSAIDSAYIVNQYSISNRENDYKCIDSTRPEKTNSPENTTTLSEVFSSHEDDSNSIRKNAVENVNYLRLGFYIFIFTIVIALIAWFVNLWLIRKSVLDDHSGPIERSIEVLSLPEGETVYDEAK